MMKNKIWLLIAVTAIGLALIGCKDEGNDNPCAKGHAFPEWIAPTCTEEGNSEKTCTRCSAIETRKDGYAALGHDKQLKVGGEVFEEPTCTETGLGEVECTRCDYYAEYGVIDALGHKLEQIDGAVTTASTCTDEGVGVMECVREGCEHEEAGGSLPLNDNNHTMGEYTQITAPTCYAKGVNQRSCNDCNFPDPVTQEGADMVAHTLNNNDWHTITPATCLETGLRERECRVAGCGYKDDTSAVIIPIDKSDNGHDWQYEAGATIATCIAPGSGTRECLRVGCNDKSTGGTYPVNPSNHTALGSTYQTRVAPTCLLNGREYFYCAAAPTGCGQHEPTTYRTVPALTHAYGGWAVFTHETCTATGLDERFCARVRDSAACNEAGFRGTQTRANLGGHTYPTTTPATCIAVSIPHDCSRVLPGTGAACGHHNPETVAPFNPNNHVVGCVPSSLPYIITGSGTEFSATGRLCLQPIQTVINDIRTHANGATVTIQFGSGGTNQLNIGTESASFNNTGGTWGTPITLTGRITSGNSGSSASNGTIVIAGAVSINSTADITNTSGHVFSNAIGNNGTGTVNISGGTVSVTGGPHGVAVRNGSTGKIIVSGTALLTTEAFGATDIGTITNTAGGSIEITGGTVRNTNTGSNAVGTILSRGTGTVTISGGTITSAGSGANVFTVHINNANGSLILSGSPVISGNGGIRASAGRLSVDSGFNPGANTYRLNFADYSSGSVLVAGGAAFISNFTLVALPDGFAAAASGADIIVGTNFHYSRQVSGGVHIITRVEQPGTANEIQPIIDAIRAETAGSPVTIQFGNGTDILNIGTQSVSFNNTNGIWTNPITLTGKITSANNADSTGTIVLANTVSINSTADIANTATGANGRAINNTGTGALNISGGTVSATVGIAVRNASTGAVNISGGTVTATEFTGTAVSNSSSGIITVSGTDTLVTSTSPSGSIGGGTINIIGGTVRNTASNPAIGISATVNISGGTVSSDRGAAVGSSGSSRINISGTALVTTGAGWGYAAVYIDDTSRLEMTGGTVRSTGSAHAIQNNRTGTSIISGGTVEANTGIAVHNSVTGTVTISGGTFTSANITLAEGTVNNDAGGSITITGGTITNTANNANANAIRNGAAGTVNLSNCTVQANAHASAHAIRNVTTDTSLITFGANVTILGNLLNCAQ